MNNNQQQENNKKEETVFTYTVKKEITKEDLEHIIIDGIETGINYWAVINNAKDNFQKEKYKGLCVSEIVCDLLFNGEEVWISDIEDGLEEEEYSLTLKKLLNGIQMNAEQRPWDCDLDNYDGDTVDAIFQYALFGEIVFG